MTEQSDKRGRGRPPVTEAQFNERREQIVRAAYEVFTEKGYHLAGIADIAERLHIGHGTVYRYFDNKREILDHVFDFGVSEIVRSIVAVDVQALESRDEMRAALRTIGRHLFDRVDESPELPRLILLEIGAIDYELTMRVLGVIESCTGLTTPLMKSAIDHGWVRGTLAPDHLARALVGSVISGMLTNLRSPMTIAQRNDYIDTVVDLYCPDA